MALFPQIAELVPEAVQGDCKIEHFVVSPRGSERSRFRAAFGRPDDYVATGRYCRLIVGREVMMSDTDMEKRSNMAVIRHAKGHVLIAGLGLGMILHPIAAKPEVLSITVIERNRNVIDLVGASLPKKVQVIEADIFEWKPPRGTKYDTIYFDIWATVCTDNLDDMARLNRKFARLKGPGAWVDSWQRDHLLYERSRQRRNPWHGYVRCRT